MASPLDGMLLHHRVPPGKVFFLSGCFSNSVQWPFVLLTKRATGLKFRLTWRPFLHQTSCCLSLSLDIFHGATALFHHKEIVPFH